MITVAVYVGWLIPGRGSITRMELPSVASSRSRVQVKIEYSRDQVGQERVRYWFGGVPQDTMFLASEGVFQSGASLTLRPHDEAAGHSGFGWILPPGTSDFFVRPSNEVSLHPLMHGQLPGDPCTGTAGCQSGAIDIGFSGTAFAAQWHPQDRLVECSFAGKPILQWSFGADRGLLPTSVSYHEFDRQGVDVASAHYSLVRTSSLDGVLDVDTTFGKGWHATVMQHGDGYGAYQSGQGDPWVFYKSARKSWTDRDAGMVPRGTNWIPTAFMAALLAAACLFVLIRALRSKKSG
jgi:hypothetical protein